jgi:hypothetical protein
MNIYPAVTHADLLQIVLEFRDAPRIVRYPQGLQRSGHLDDKSLVSAEEMFLKIHSAKANISDPDFLLIARTDAIAVEGVGRALGRAKAYIDAGGT